MKLVCKAVPDVGSTKNSKDNSVGSVPYDEYIYPTDDPSVILTSTLY
jgi:hypothetical protein